MAHGGPVRAQSRRVFLAAVLSGALSAGLPARAQKPAASVWVKDASKAPSPNHALTGSLATSPFTMRKAVWRRDQHLAFADDPLDIMVLELQVRTARTPRLPRLPGLKAPSGPTDATFALRISTIAGAPVAGQRIVHQTGEHHAPPETATKEKPALMGAEVDLGDKGSLDAPYSLVVEFGPRRGAVQPGTIYLCLEDGAKTFIAGTFEAVVK